MLAAENNRIYIDTINPIFFIILIICALLIITLLRYNGSTITQHLGTIGDTEKSMTVYQQIKSTIRMWMGKMILYINMRGDAVVYNYPFEKGIFTKLFDRIESPQI